MGWDCRRLDRRLAPRRVWSMLLAGLRRERVSATWAMAIAMGCGKNGYLKFRYLAYLGLNSMALIDR